MIGYNILSRYMKSIQGDTSQECQKVVRFDRVRSEADRNVQGAAEKRHERGLAGASGYHMLYYYLRPELIANARFSNSWATFEH